MTDPTDDTDYPGALAIPQADDALTDEALEIVSGGVHVCQ